MPVYTNEIRRIWNQVSDPMRWYTTKDLNPRPFREWLVEHNTESPRTRNAYLAAISGFCQWMKDNNFIPENPMRKIAKFRSVGQRAHPRRAYTLEEFRKLCETKRRGLTYLIAGLSGLRRTELTRLQKMDVNAGPNPTWHLRAEATKSKRREILPMMPEAADRIRQHLEALPDENSRVFKSIPCHRTLAKDLSEAGIKNKDNAGRYLDFHSLRYFFCTLLAKRLPIQTVAKLMRHRDIRTTCNLYLDLGLTDIAEATISLPRILEEAPTPVSAPKSQEQEP